MERRTPDYYSPTSINLFFKDREQFFLNYVLDREYRPEREPQTQPMAIGSAFDSYIKNHIFNELFDETHPEHKTYLLDKLLKDTVDPHNVAWAKRHGAYAYSVYMKSGALQSLMNEMKNATTEPRMEFKIESVIKQPSIKGGQEGINLLGKPDLYFKNEKGHTVIYDWKVNGWCSKSGVSPTQGYLKLFAENKDLQYINQGEHKKCIPGWHDGMRVNTNGSFEQYDESWATQLCIYSWLTGTPVGQPIVIGIDQLVCKPRSIEFPVVRVAVHRSTLSKEFQLRTYMKALRVKHACETGHIFTEMTRQQSDKKCEELEKIAIDRKHNPCPALDRLFSSRPW